MRNEKEIEMTYKECLEICTKRMCVMGYFPDEIEAAAKEMYFRRNGLLCKWLHYVQQVRATLMMLLPCTSGRMGTLSMR